MAKTGSGSSHIVYSVYQRSGLLLHQMAHITLSFNSIAYRNDDNMLYKPCYEPWSAKDRLTEQLAKRCWVLLRRWQCITGYHQH